MMQYRIKSDRGGVWVCVSECVCVCVCVWGGGGDKKGYCDFRRKHYKNAKEFNINSAIHV